MEGSHNEVNGFANVGCIGSLLNDSAHSEHFMGNRGGGGGQHK
jgi:hypothetical protein